MGPFFNNNKLWALSSSTISNGLLSSSTNHPFCVVHLCLSAVLLLFLSSLASCIHSVLLYDGPLAFLSLKELKITFNYPPTLTLLLYWKLGKKTVYGGRCEWRICLLRSISHCWCNGSCFTIQSEKPEHTRSINEWIEEMTIIK